MNPIQSNAPLFESQQVYTDLNQLNAIRRQGQEDQSAALKAVAKQFESMFTQMMLKSMRSANDVFAKDNPLNTPEMKFRQQMYDDQLGVSLSQGNGLGLADVLYRQLSRQFIDSDSEPKTDNGFRTTHNNPYTNTHNLDTHNMPQRIKDATAMNGLESVDDFIELISPYAKKVADTIGTDYRYLVAQTALETGWGKHAIRDENGNHSFNLFNIKADSRWSGRSVAVPTIEFVDGIPETQSANFRRYSSIIDSFKDYENFIQQPRYQEALTQSDKPSVFIQELHKAGYATDPKYAQKIQAIVDQYFPADPQQVSAVTSQVSQSNGASL